jgi:ribosome maturation protein Sdo1
MEARRSKKRMTFKCILQAMSANRIDTYGDIHFPGDRIGVALEAVRIVP